MNNRKDLIEDSGKYWYDEEVGLAHKKLDEAIEAQERGIRATEAWRETEPDVRGD